MISKQPRNDSGIDASASIGSAWFRRGTLDVNQVIGDTTAVRLNVMGEKTHDAGRDKVKNERYGCLLYTSGTRTEDRAADAG